MAFQGHLHLQTDHQYNGNLFFFGIYDLFQRSFRSKRRVSFGLNLYDSSDDEDALGEVISSDSDSSDSELENRILES